MKENRTYYKGSIYQYDLQGNFIAEHESQKQAGITLNVHPKQINQVLKKIRKSAGGFQFSYIKRKSIPPISTSSNVGTYESINKKIEIPFKDHGVINDKNSFYFGKRKISIGASLWVYCDPNKNVNNIVEKYQKSLKL